MFVVQKTARSGLHILLGGVCALAVVVFFRFVSTLCPFLLLPYEDFFRFGYVWMDSNLTMFLSYSSRIVFYEDTCGFVPK